MVYPTRKVSIYPAGQTDCRALPGHADQKLALQVGIMPLARLSPFWLCQFLGRQ